MDLLDPFLSLEPRGPTASRISEKLPPLVISKGGWGEGGPDTLSSTQDPCIFLPKLK